MKSCPLTGATDHRVTWRCYVLVVLDGLAGSLPYPLVRPVLALIRLVTRNEPERPFTETAIAESAKTLSEMDPRHRKNTFLEAP